ncbi:MAG: hypothetical protein KBD37_01475 [Burkholderiales bacterium]|nr:hypothetical protein [Burkholderiales bacterium]
MIIDNKNKGVENITTFIIDDSRFEIVEYIKKLRSAGATQELAEVQAQELEHALNGILKYAEQKNKELFNNKELATKLDIKELEVKIAWIESRLINWVLGVGISATVILCGSMFTMLKLMLH